MSVDRGTGDPPGPGHIAAHLARGSAEEALFSLASMNDEIDRETIKNCLLRVIQCAYAVLDSSVIAAVHFDGLTQAAAAATEARELIRRGKGSLINDTAASLARTAEALRLAADEVAEVQLARRLELVGGNLDEPLPAARPLRASIGLPSLHALTRRPLLPFVAIEPKAKPDAPKAPVAPPRPSSMEELAAFARASASGELEEQMMRDEERAKLDEPAPPSYAYEPAVEEAEVLRRLARDCLEDIANHAPLRRPNAIEGWTDQEPFEQRLLDNLDAFAALGGPVLPMVSLFAAEAPAPDPERAFAVALTLGSIEGADATGAVIMALKQSAPEMFPGFVEGLWLAPSPSIDAALADLATHKRADLVALALDVLHLRGATSEAAIEPLLDRDEPAIASRVARALATCFEREDAIMALEDLAETGADEVFLAAALALLARRHGRSLDLLRAVASGDASSPRARGALELLSIAGRASDLDTLIAAANRAPSASLIRGIGRFGHAGALRSLVSFLYHDDKEVITAAAESLERITGAGLRETIEEPWDIELPPEAKDVPGALPIPTRKVERVIKDPAAWTSWLDRHERELDPKLKHRGGQPFTPMMIVDELESKVTPPDRRGEAALELSLVTGFASSFSPNDWVARQRRHLAELRARVASLAAPAGVWSFGLASPAASSNVPIRRARKQSTVEAPIAPLPVAAPPPIAAPLPVATPITVPPITAPSPVDVPAAPPLPFAPPPPIVHAPPPAPRPPEAPALGRTVAFKLPEGFNPGALPFVKGPPAEAPSSTPPSTLPLPKAPHEQTTFGDSTGPASQSPLRPVLPFQPAPPPQPAAPAPRASQPGAPPETLRASQIPELTLAQYALLWLELHKDPSQTGQIAGRYGIYDARALSAVHALWRDRMARDPALYARWVNLTTRG